jgi:CheY-like chemotaxis protein
MRTIRQQLGHALGRPAVTRPSRILLLQDSPAMLDLMREAIRATGWKAHLSEGAAGTQALDILRRSHLAGTTPDLVMIACSVAGDRCLDTLRIIRSYPGCRFQPIVILAELMPYSSIIDALESFHVLAVLARPADAASCVTLVRRLMSHFTRAGHVTPKGSWVSGRLTAEQASARRLQD